MTFFMLESKTMKRLENLPGVTVSYPPAGEGLMASAMRELRALRLSPSQ
jgi:hypothetical protein